MNYTELAEAHRNIALSDLPIEQGGKILAGLYRPLRRDNPANDESQPTRVLGASLERYQEFDAIVKAIAARDLLGKDIPNPQT